MRVQYTKSGLAAIYDSLLTGIKFDVSYFKIGRAVLPLDGEDYTDVVDQVFPEVSSSVDIAMLQSMMRYYANDTSDNQATFEVTLNEKIGDSREVDAPGNVNFEVGNIGFFYHDPINGTDTSKDLLIAIASNEIPVKKYRKISVNEATDIQQYYVTLTFKDITDIINVVADIKLDYSNLPSIENMSMLPAATSAPYNMYLINSSEYTSCLAVRRVNYIEGSATWDFYYPNQGITVPSSSFADAVAYGQAVCFKNGLFDICNGYDPTFPYVGIRTSATTIQNIGNYLPGFNCRIGSTYYVTENGGLSYTPTLYSVGVAIAYDTIALFYTNPSNSTRINDLSSTPTILLGDPSKFKISSIVVFAPGANYINGAASINGIPVILTTQLGSVIAISGWPHQVFDTDISGTYPIVQAGNSSGSATIITAYGEGNDPILGELQYAHDDDPVVQLSYLRAVREGLYDLTEVALTDLNNIPLGRYIVSAGSTAANAPINFPGGLFISERLKNSQGTHFVRIQSMSRPTLKWVRSLVNNAWKQWQFEYADYFPGT